MTMRQLQYFVTVAEERSFTKASGVLHIAQPPLSTQIREFERELGVELFRRSHRGVELTPAGEALLPEARRLLYRYDSLGRLARQAQHGEVGHLTIGLIPAAGNGLLPDVVRHYRDEFPHVEISLIEDRPGSLLRRLDVGELDVSLQYMPPAGAGYGWRTVEQEALIVAMPATHALARRRRVPVGALAGEALILPARHGGEGLYERISRLLAEHEVMPQVVQGDIWLMQTIVGLVAAGIGLAVVPESARVIRPGEVVYRQLAGPRETVPLVAVWRAAGERAAGERAAGERAAEELPVVRRFIDKWAQLLCSTETNTGH
ncbi:MAG TPA: LysR substrate-binding domain-containing protein [Trebonia sp.]|jgi:DNA-binding transcriptional LysR family regulator|nr:LysR substrate-binding domain-containing protein [Trebonia sp.]